MSVKSESLNREWVDCNSELRYWSLITGREGWCSTKREGGGGHVAYSASGKVLF